MTFNPPPLDWQNDEDCVRVARFVIEWIMAEDAADDPANHVALIDNLKRTSCHDLVDDILVTITDDRQHEEAHRLLGIIQRGH